MATIVYLHGFASTGVSPKSNKLIKEFPNDTIICRDLPFSPDEVVALIGDIVHNTKDFPVIFVGTSLGGFWANYFAQKFDAPCVLVNPSVNPDETMKARVGKTVLNYKTGALIPVTERDVERFKFFKEDARALQNGALVHLFLAKDDDLLDYRTALKEFEHHMSCTVTQDGGHRYDMHWDLVVAHIKHLLDAPNDTSK